MQGRDHLLVFRLSSLGDVAMTVPVIRLLLEQHPSLQITMVSQGWMKPLFAGMPRLQFHSVDLKGRHNGVRGLLRLYNELHRLPYSAIADLHDVLRTKFLRTIFRVSGSQLSVIDKGRKGKRELTRPNNKILRQLPTTFERYAACFAALGFPVKLLDASSTGSRKQVGRVVKVGIAPAAQYAEKTYPTQQMEEVIHKLLAHPSIHIQLYGGAKEVPLFDEWELKWERVHSVAGKFDLGGELAQIKDLDVMISMDSANMHLASMMNVPVVSIWGGTHPFLGFAGWKNDPENFVQVELDCRPSSVYGNKRCRNNCACMHRISPLHIYERTMRLLQNLEHEFSTADS